ncbi:peroxidase-related enzyme [Streptomyces sp. 3MP-14]|uniref:Peroxidase-related enzyme n=1 Tax=Streptomyces mimosae TaxID=2586635 RepID=A0A5N5ZZB7_9ACTN|nr:MULTISPECIES: peroxidase-related enzyme [Streptomyces]KAB8161837.1 peroxidase-related enzyme [Streptomyces mimosae]KAB8174895.1 peroxidase-related enzyme [Streptomyces sp. 3MP-14]
MSTTPETKAVAGQVADDIGRLAGLNERIAAARAGKPLVIERAQAAGEALFEGNAPVPAPVRRGLAALAARWHGLDDLVRHHAERDGDPTLWDDAPPADPALRAAVAHVDLVTVSPALATREDLDRLVAAGWSPDAVVTISQTAAFTAFQVRAVQGLRLLQGHPVVPAPAPARPTPGRGRRKSTARTAANGRERPVAYTRELLSWTAWVPPVPTDELTEEQEASFRGKTNGEYFRLLSRLPAVLAARTALDAAIFATREGLPRAERELAAAATSKVTDCVYCASVHARKSAQLSKRPEDVDRLLAVALERDADWLPLDTAPLAEGQDERWAAIVAFAAALATTPVTATPEHVARLRALGLTDAELTDLVAATAFFAWANRLMLSLGDPYWPDDPTTTATPRP